MTLTPELLPWAALTLYALGAVFSIAGIWRESLRQGALLFVVGGLGLLLQSAAIGANCAQSSTHFFNSPSEICGLFAWALAVSYMLALFVTASRSIGAVMLPGVCLLIALSLTLSREGVPLRIPSSLFSTHLLSAFLGYGLFLTACGAGMLYLGQAWLMKRKNFGAIFRDMPSLQKLERLETVCAILGLLSFTLALFTGAKMAQQLNQAFWFEPKTISSELTWLTFVVMLAGRATHLLSARAAARLILAGAALVLITFALAHPFGKAEVTGQSAQKNRMEATDTLACVPQNRYMDSAHTPKMDFVLLQRAFGGDAEAPLHPLAKTDRYMSRHDRCQGGVCR